MLIDLILKSCVFPYLETSGISRYSNRAVLSTSTHQAFGRRIPFALLEDIKNRFLASYGDAREVGEKGKEGSGG